MVHEHFEEHKNQLFAGKKLKNHGRLPKGQKKNRTKLLFRGIRHDCQFAEKYYSVFRFAHLYYRMLPTGRTSLMLSTISRFLLHQHVHLLIW